MPSFIYTYRNTEGVSTIQTLNAYDRKQALMLLKKQGIVALKLEESGTDDSNKASKKPNFIHLLGSKKEALNSRQAEQGNAQKGLTTAKGENIGLNLLKRLYELHKS